MEWTPAASFNLLHASLDAVTILHIAPAAVLRLVVAAIFVGCSLARLRWHGGTRRLRLDWAYGGGDGDRSGNRWSFPAVSRPMGHQPPTGSRMAYQTIGHRNRPFDCLAHGTLHANWATALIDGTKFPCQARPTDVGHAAWWADMPFGLSLCRNGPDVSHWVAKYCLGLLLDRPDKANQTKPSGHIRPKTIKVYGKFTVKPSGFL
jgi:hypothetical protein